MIETRKRRLAMAWPVALVLTVLLFACEQAAPPAVETPAAPETGSAPTEEEVRAALGAAQDAADTLVSGLMSALGDQLAAGGPPQAVRACSEIAPSIAEELSTEGREVGRTTLRPRNPANAPDRWERQWLEALQASRDAGQELPSEIQEVVDGRLRYLRPIFVAPPCLNCHGSAEQIDPEVQTLLDERYPEDRATGYESGDLRGAVSVSVELSGASAR